MYLFKIQLDYLLPYQVNAGSKEASQLLPCLTKRVVSSFAQRILHADLLNNYKVINDTCLTGLEDFDDVDDLKEIFILEDFFSFLIF